MPSHRLLRLPLRSLPHPATQWRLLSPHQPLRRQPVCLVPQPHRYHPWLRHNHPHITRVIPHILAMEKRIHTFVAKGGSQIGGLCDEEGHFAYRCPARTILQCILRQQAQETARGPPRGQILELPTPDGSQGPPQGHLNF